MDEKQGTWDTGSLEGFYTYYEKQSLSQETLNRFSGTRDCLLQFDAAFNGERQLDVLDIGCGAGSQGMLWHEKGHRYVGIDINAPLIALAQKRAEEFAISARFEVGSATELPFPDASFDICMMPELLEHVAQWETCMQEAMRCLRPDGLLFLSTNNALCPVQQEFNLPMYSWYPGPLKRYFERRSVTDWPELVNFAKYPAVNWFTYYSLRKYVAKFGFDAYDRLDFIDASRKSPIKRLLIHTIRRVPGLRFAAQFATAYTALIARKQRNSK